MIVEFQEYMNSEVQGVLDEKKDALPLLIRLRELTKNLEQWTAQIDAIALQEALKYSEKSFKLQGAKVEIREVGTKWFYDKTGDSVLPRILEAKNKIAEREKERQAFLKTLKEPMQVLDEETGELVTVYPARKESKTGLVITLS